MSGPCCRSCPAEQPARGVKPKCARMGIPVPHRSRLPRRYAQQEEAALLPMLEDCLDGETDDRLLAIYNTVGIGLRRCRMILGQICRRIPPLPCVFDRSMSPAQFRRASSSGSAPAADQVGSRLHTSQDPGGSCCDEARPGCRGGFDPAAPHPATNFRSDRKCSHKMPCRKRLKQPATDCEASDGGARKPRPRAEGLWLASHR